MLKLQRVFTGAEQLSAGLPKRLEQACGCPLVNFYGAEECNLMAWECLDCGNYHSCDDGVLLEVLRDGRPALPGEEGEVVITALHSYAMPFIRHRLGDVVRLPRRPSECRCRFGAIERIEGRVVDYLHFPGSDPVSPYTLMDQLDVLKGLVRYEAEQTAPTSLLIRYQRDCSEAAASLDAVIRSRCAAALPRGVELETRSVARFDSNPSQKRRFIRALPPQALTTGPENGKAGL